MRTETKTFARRATTLSALTAAGMLGLSGLAVADNLQDSITAGDAPVTLVKGSSSPGTATIKLVGNSSAGDNDPGCNIDPGDNPLVVDIVTPTGVTATPDPLSITSCGTDFTVSFRAGNTAVGGTATVAILSQPAGGGTIVNQVSIPITVTSPNTKPTVAVTGVEDGGRYEIGAVPTAGCDVTDAEDGPSTATPVTTGTLSHGLGNQTVTCNASDSNGVAAEPATATYTIVDTGEPTITGARTPAANAAGWNNTDVTVSFECADLGGSGIQSCTEDATLGEGANQSVTGTATDWAGNTKQATVSGINIDKTAPTAISFSSAALGGDVYFGDVPAKPTCSADGGLSGLATCDVTGYSTAVGSHTLTATATDNAGNTDTATFPYTVKAWKTNGFYSPVDTTTGETKIWNTAKGGSTIPLKFELFKGTTEITDVTKIQSLTVVKTGAPEMLASSDEIETLASVASNLRYDATGGQFIQNWKTPTGAGSYKVTMTALDGTTAIAYFNMRK